ncbi:hypothetical protein A0H81_14136 [Grifola frondosa]|uniref:Uncharacterized protein n=1 Tax=Grifola frondosa TaxID=5627 RepID=A0A1C7LM10_GRIFR|nr:hypothetical protein A0H81_14136 [Grifola frondosa]
MSSEECVGITVVRGVGYGGRPPGTGWGGVSEGGIVRFSERTRETAPCTNQWMSLSAFALTGRERTYAPQLANHED